MGEPSPDRGTPVFDYKQWAIITHAVSRQLDRDAFALRDEEDESTREDLRAYISQAESVLDAIRDAGW